MSDVYIVPCPDYKEQTVSDAMHSLIEKSGALNFVKQGMKIVIKANLVTLFKPEAAATTHPQLLCALTKELIARGASVVIGDSPGGLYNAVFLRKVYSLCGINAVQDFGGELNFDFSQKKAEFPKAAVLKNFEYTAFLDDCDAIINFCKLKTHGMMGMSAAVKNMFGAIPGTFKPEYHMRFPKHSAFADMLVDLNEYFKPVYTFVDAVEGMEGNGPTMGTPRHIGALLCAASPYKLDLACAKIIGIPFENVPTLVAAAKRNLAPDSVTKIDIDGDIDSFIKTDFKLVVDNKDIRFKGKGNIMSSALGLLARTFLQNRPALSQSECIGCGKCAEICPAKAIEIKNKKAVISRKKCIRCFCCQEFCPVGAMKVKRSAVSKLINR